MLDVLNHKSLQVLTLAQEKVRSQKQPQRLWYHTAAAHVLLHVLTTNYEAVFFHLNNVKSQARKVLPQQPPLDDWGSGASEQLLAQKSWLQVDRNNQHLSI